MKTVKYVGPFDEVEIESYPGVWLSCKRNHRIEVSDQVGEGLLAQPANWIDPTAPVVDETADDEPAKAVHKTKKAGA